jgi:hypothetical protein
MFWYIPTPIHATNMDQWKKEIVTLWVIKMHDSQYLRILIESMQRLQKVIEQDGGMTKY